MRLLEFHLWSGTWESTRGSCSGAGGGTVTENEFLYLPGVAWRTPSAWGASAWRLAYGKTWLFPLFPDTIPVACLLWLALYQDKLPCADQAVIELFIAINSLSKNLFILCPPSSLPPCWQLNIDPHVFQVSQCSTISYMQGLLLIFKSHQVYWLLSVNWR